MLITFTSPPIAFFKPGNIKPEHRSGLKSEKVSEDRTTNTMTNNCFLDYLLQTLLSSLAASFWLPDRQTSNEGCHWALGGIQGIRWKCPHVDSPLFYYVFGVCKKMIQ
jgi:hypothetical protein